MSPYDPVEFQYQVRNDATDPELAYLVPEGLPWGSTLEIDPGQVVVPSGGTAIFSCRLALDPAVVRPGCTNDQGFRLTAWRAAHDADERWGSCFYFVRPRVRTRVDLLGADWVETRLSVRGRLALDSEEPVVLATQLPLQVRIRLAMASRAGSATAWTTATVQPSGAFVLQLEDTGGKPDAILTLQAWFDRTDLLASSRSGELVVAHQTIPVIG